MRRARRAGLRLGGWVLLALAFFRELASAIRTFYPRVTAIDFVPLRSGSDPALTTRERARRAARAGEPTRTCSARSTPCA